MKNAKHIVKTVLFCGTLAVFSAVSVFSPKEKGSFYENRRLAVFPVASVETVLDGTFFSDVETYISDHFACRVPLLRLNVHKELALHNPVVSNTVIAGDTLLPYHGKPRTDYDHENMQTVLDALSQVSAACETVGAKFIYLSIPEQSSALRYKYPSYLTSGTYTDDSMRTDFLAGLDARGIDCLNMADYLCTDSEKYYSKTDHHYNFYGAYETYLRTMEHLQTLGIDAPVTTDVTIASDVPADLNGLVSVVTADAKLYIPLAELVDLAAERKRLSKELEKKKKYLGGIEKKLSNEKFLAKAPEDVIQRERDNMAKAQKEIQQLESSLADLG